MGAAAVGRRLHHEPGARRPCSGLCGELDHRMVCLRPPGARCAGRGRQRAHRRLRPHRTSRQAARGSRPAAAREYRHALFGAEEVMFYEPDKRDKRLLPHDPFKAIVAPRPIGWVTSISAKNEVNLAPYSYFNGVNSRPCLLYTSDAADE